MSKVDRKQIKNMILKEMRMLGMADMMPMSDPPPSHGHGDEGHGAPEMHSHSKGTVSREDCCAAVMCLIECCECPATRRELERCCADLMSGRHDS